MCVLGGGGAVWSFNCMSEGIDSERYRETGTPIGRPYESTQRLRLSLRPRANQSELPGAPLAKAIRCEEQAQHSVKLKIPGPLRAVSPTTPQLPQTPPSAHDSLRQQWGLLVKAITKSPERRPTAIRCTERCARARATLMGEYASRVRQIRAHQRTVAFADASKADARTGGELADAALSLFHMLDAEVHRIQSILVQAPTRSDASSMSDVADAQQWLHAGGFMGNLMPFQLDGLRWLLARHDAGGGAILADEMGLGKTVQVIALLLALRGRSAGAVEMGPTLVLVPLSTIDSWEAEFACFADPVKPLRVLSLRGGAVACQRQLHWVAQRREQMKPVPYDVVLTPHSRFVRHHDVVVRRLLCLDWGYVVVDEAQRIKNQAARMTQLLLKVSASRRLALTGTPLQNDLLELWSLLCFVVPRVFSPHDNRLGKVFEHIVKLQRERRNSAFAETAEREIVICNKLHEMLRPIILRRDKQEVASQLPSHRETTLYCPLTAPQRLALEEALLQTTQPHQTAAKVLLHPYTLQDSYFMNEKFLQLSGKFSVLDIILRFLSRCNSLAGDAVPPHKVLLFSSSIVTLDMVAQYCHWRSFKCVRLDGRVALDGRQSAIESFRADPECFIFLISKKAGGVGLNLQAADTVLMLDVHYNPQTDLQALARAWRMGQAREVRVLRLVTDTPFERRIMDISASKLAVESKVIAAGRYNQRSTDEERERVLRDILDDAGTKAGHYPPPPVAADVESHLRDSLHYGLCRGEAEELLLQRMVEEEGLLRNLVTNSATFHPADESLRPSTRVVIEWSDSTSSSSSHNDTPFPSSSPAYYTTTESEQSVGREDDGGGCLNARSLPRYCDASGAVEDDLARLMDSDDVDEDDA